MTNKELLPKHTIMAKKLAKLFEFNQMKNMQYSFFKLMIYEQSPGKSPRASLELGSRRTRELYDDPEARR